MQALVDVTIALSVLVVLWMAWLAWRGAKGESVGLPCQRCGAPDSSQLWTTRDDWGRYVHHWVCPACKAQLESTRRASVEDQIEAIRARV
jgi:Zn ribbon nucleic-acid-binding protein